ncbi:Large ribosomal subunit protein [Trichinella spiralis]|uniref:Large ribosomal subunit protein n=1 Tax=Trichinella spiralis TaxID=6334 RepID=A0ABR3KSU2_TRISP
MLLGGHPLNDWSMKFNDQVHRLSKLQKNMVHLSRRIGPRQHGLLIDLVNLHDRLRSLTSHFQRNLLHFQRDLSPLIETEKNMLKSTATHVTNTNAIDNTSFHASTTFVEGLCCSMVDDRSAKTFRDARKSGVDKLERAAS